MFYVSLADELSQTSQFLSAEKDDWGELWNSVNDEFNRFFDSRDALKHLVDCKFFVCDGNHKQIAWMNHITRLHSTEIKWHYCVDSIILDTRNRISLTMQVMHDVNKYVFHALHLHLLIAQGNFFPPRSLRILISCLFFV